jgi:hypothetical protein
MIKNKNAKNSPFFLLENLVSFQANIQSFFNIKKTTVGAVFNITESITLDLPIAYANIRV